MRTNLKIPSPHTSFLLRMSFAPNSSTSSPLKRSGGWGMGVAVRSLHVSATPSSSQSFPAWSPTHGRQSFTNLFNMDPSYRLHFFMNCPSMGPFHGGQSFRNRLLPVQVPHRVTTTASKPSPAWSSLYGPQFLPGPYSSTCSPRGHSLL